MHCFAQTFIKTFGGAGNDEGNAVLQTYDNGYVICGSKNINGTGSLIYLIKTNTSGDTLWTKTYGGSTNDYGTSIAQTSDSGFILAGTTMFGLGAGDIYVIKVDSSGNLQWSRTIGSISPEQGLAVKQTINGDYFVFGRGTFNPIVCKLNMAGNLLWSKTYGQNGTNGRDMQLTSDGGCIITGEASVGIGAGGYDAYLLKIDSSGNSHWAKTYGGINDDAGISVKQTNDNGFIIAGFTYSFGVGSISIYLIKTNSIGDTLWTKVFSISEGDLAYSVNQTSDGGYIIAGINNVLLKTDLNGNVTWAKIFGFYPYGRNYSVQQIADGGYIVSGRMCYFGAGNLDISLIKTDSSGNTSCNFNNYTAVVSTTSTQVFNQSDSVYINGAINSPNTITGSDCKACSSCSVTLFFSGLADTVCINSVPIVLTGNTPGAIFSGTGVTDTIFNPSVTGLGLQHVYYSFADASGCNFFYSQPVFVDVCSSVSFLPEESFLTISPNPSQGDFVINANETTNNYRIEIMNIVGDIIFKENNLIISKHEIHIKNISDGIYFLKLFNGEKIFISKIIIAKD